MTRYRELLTRIMRVAAFASTLVPLAVLALPWVSLDGTDSWTSGIHCFALLATPMRVYLYSVSPIQAAFLTIGPVLVGCLAIVTGYRYQRRRSIVWAPPAMAVISGTVAFGTADLVNGVGAGLTITLVVSLLLTLHQVAIRVQGALRRNMKLPGVYRALAVLTGVGHHQFPQG